MSNPIGWPQLFDLTKDAEVKEAIKTLLRFDKAYDKILKSSNKTKTKVARNIKAMVDSTKTLDTQAAKLNITTETGQKALLEMSGRADVLTSSYSNLKGKIIDITASTAKLTKEKRAVAASTRETIKLQKQEAQLSAKLASLDTKEAAAVKKLQVQIAEKNKQMKKSAQESLGLITIYQKETQTLINLRNKYKDVALQHGVNSKEARKLRKEVELLDNRLKRLDASGGQHHRFIGRYSTAFKGLAISMRSVGAALGFAGALFALVAIMRNAVKTIFEFDKEMVNLAAISGKTRSEMKGLEMEIRRVAKTSINTANEVAKTATALRTLGKTEVEIIGLLEPVNNLSIALHAAADEAGELLVKTLNAFGESADEALHYANVIAAIRTSTALDFQRISDALGFLAPTAKTVGLTIEQTGAVLGVLVDNGIKAARAGRLMNSSFARLNDKGLTLNQALEAINESEDRLATATRLFGKESFALAIILADNIEKTNNLAEAFTDVDNVLRDLTQKQLKSLSAQSKILGAIWEELILTFESGEGVFGQFMSGVMQGFGNFLTVITAAEAGTISWGRAVIALQDPIQMAIALGVIQATEASKLFKEQARLTFIANEAQRLYNVGIKNGRDTWADFQNLEPERLLAGVAEKTEILTAIQKLYNAELEETAEITRVTYGQLKDQVTAANAALDQGTKQEWPALIAEVNKAEQALEDFLFPGKFEAFDKTLKTTVDNLIAEVPKIPAKLEPAIEAAKTSTADMMNFIEFKIESFVEGVGRQFIELGFTVAELFDNLAERANQKDEERIERIRETSAKEIAIAGENQQAIAAVEETRDKQIADLEKRIADRQKRAARFTKAIRIAEAIMETAYWVTKFGVITPPAILAGVIGAVKVAAIAAEPIPTYFKGTTDHPGGLAEVAERGREVIKEPGKKAYVQSKRATLNLPAHTKVFTSTQSERMLDGPDRESAINVQSAHDIRRAINAGQVEEAKRIAIAMGRDAETIVEGFENAVKEIPVTVWAVKQGQLGASIRKGDNTYNNIENENSF